MAAVQIIRLKRYCPALAFSGASVSPFQSILRQELPQLLRCLATR